MIGICTGRTRATLAAALLVLLGMAIGTARLRAIDRAEIAPFLGHAVTVRGFVVKRERPTPHAYRLRLRVRKIAEGLHWRGVSDLVQVEAKRRPPELTIGREVQMHGVLSGLSDPRGVRQSSDRADYVAFLHRGGVHGLLRADSIEVLGRRGGPLGILDALRRRAEAGVGAGLGPRLSPLATGIVLGQDERIPDKTVEQFQVSGLAHLLAVSGQNVTLLAVLALPILGAFGFGRSARLIGVLGLIVVYVPLTGAGPSIMRAGAMGAAATVAQLSGSPASRWYGLLLAFCFTLTIDPRAWLDAGWQLSFAAVVGIFLLAKPLGRSFHRLPAPLAEGAALTVSATLATAPLLAFHFERLSLVSLFANLAALPVVAPIMWIGTLAAVAAQLSIAPAALLNALNGYCLAYLAAVASWSAAVPSAAVHVRIASTEGLALAYLVPAGALAGLAAARRAAPSRKRLRLLLVPGAIAAVVTAVAWAALARHSAKAPPDRFTITFLDVGQGDATLLQAPHAVAVLVDGGPPESGVVSKLRAAGVHSLDLVVLTHPQLDHQGGLENVLRQLPVRVLLDGGWHEPFHDRIIALARSRGVRILAPRAGMDLRIGRLRIQVLWPPSPGLPDRDVDPNQRAVVALASYGKLDTLLTADAESDVTASLPLRRVELLKVAHHGSADQGLAYLLERLSPEAAVIEVGRTNRYGHPDPHTLATLRRAVPIVRRTDRDGNVTASQGGDGLTISTQR
jgi:competence protein ComEC